MEALGQVRLLVHESGLSSTGLAAQDRVELRHYHRSLHGSMDLFSQADRIWMSMAVRQRPSPSAIEERLPGWIARNRRPADKPLGFSAWHGADVVVGKQVVENRLSKDQAEWTCLLGVGGNVWKGGGSIRNERGKPARCYRPVFASWSTQSRCSAVRVFGKRTSICTYRSPRRDSFI